jgi:hypothetical protein
MPLTRRDSIGIKIGFFISRNREASLTMEREEEE